MSLVQCVITDDFALVGADTRGTDKDGSIKEDVNKLIRINKNIIVGCTGGVIDNFKLFNGYCCYSPEFGLHGLDDTINILYEEFVEKIENRFNSMLNECKSKIHSYSIGSIICGYNNDNFEFAIFTLNTPNVEDGVRRITRYLQKPYNAMSLGSEKHFELLDEMLYNEFQNKKPTILNIKNLMKNVFETGSKFDASINSNVCFEVIRKKDVKNSN